MGYRLIDTAQSYFNEQEVGNAIKKAALPVKKFSLQQRFG